ncbi:N-acetylmuramoyl-L-alanine amidase CwlD [Clostridium polyendosporum]|uniref:N-acetylmuramoyl-L-alanine amidase CwlD n=1 Tax=Clostridium polyendosporum TaxID=69208 RepID=A0A919S1W4_9CLOT|nr:N-acetylmuramoyl-L-alanine amidase CwlD [Clostridium polyendosporum]GIM29929.1 N-acetylmuramoyl-L-alanine amidase CwlD [Clostridium polyendosporum]
MKGKAKFALVCCLILMINSLKVLADVKHRTDEKEKKIILIDPGHGGIDGGAKSKSGIIEKDINLSISKKLKEALIKEGYIVYMTREDDIGLYDKGKTLKEKKVQDLSKRVKMKEDTKCHIFISIHQNMFPQTKCHGAQVWHAAGEESKLLADIIQGSLRENVDNENKRLTKPAGDQYRILREGSPCASVLVECGFLSNQNEGNMLKDEQYQQKIAEAITKGVVEYCKQKKAGEN